MTRDLGQVSVGLCSRAFSCIVKALAVNNTCSNGSTDALPWVCSCSALEVYNDTCIDLLAPSANTILSSRDDPTWLEVRLAMLIFIISETFCTATCCAQKMEHARSSRCVCVGARRSKSDRIRQLNICRTCVYCARVSVYTHTHDNRPQVMKATKKPSN